MGIIVNHVCYTIDHTTILNDVTLDIQSGMVGVIGPNGAGKTTLLRTISGYFRPSSGAVLIDGMDVTQMEVRDRARKMALVPQSYAMEYDFSVLEIVLMGRNPHKKMFEADSPADIRLARESIAMAGISHLESRSVLGLSGGEWQRMIIARALCQQSEILLLDEPVSNLDIRHQTGILRIVRNLVDAHSLIAVCVLHDLNLALHYCTGIVLMDGGKVVAHGSPSEVLTPENLERVYQTKINIVDCGGTNYIFPVMNI